MSPVFVVIFCLIWAAATVLAVALFPWMPPLTRAALLLVIVIAARELLYVTLRR